MECDVFGRTAVPSSSCPRAREQDRLFSTSIQIRFSQLTPDGMLVIETVPGRSPIEIGVRDDGTYISATAVGALCEVDLTDLADPAVSTGHLPTLVLSAPGGGGITIRLRQGTTTIAAWTYYPGPPATEYTPTLSGAEADSITDYTALRFQFEAIA